MRMSDQIRDAKAAAAGTHSTNVAKTTVMLLTSIIVLA
jgi:hypothetical protein